MPTAGAPAGRRARVRNRLLVSVTLCAAAVLAAGAPTLAAASADTKEAQDLVERAELGRRAIALSHSLADERDSVVAALADTGPDGGGPDGGGPDGAEPRVDGPGASLRARVDRQAAKVRGAAPDRVRARLAALPQTRREARTGPRGARAAYEAYSETIQALRGIAQDAARELPARAQSATAGALPELARAVDQASATRGLLRGALAGSGAQRALTSRAQQARAREQAALDDFEETADRADRERYRTTVTGTDVNAAERYLARLTDRPYLTARDRALSAERVDAALSARIAHIRGVQSSFAAAEVKRLEGLRDDDVDALQLRAALVGACLLLALAVSVWSARSVARPLSVLRRGSGRLAADPAGTEPITFRGRNDEFADVVRALNALRESAAGLQRRASWAESEQDQLAVAKAELTEQHELLRQDHAALQEQARQSSVAGHALFERLARRTLELAERQLDALEGLEARETDPDRLGALFTLDHLATRMRRHSDTLLLLAGAPRGGDGAGGDGGAPPGPAPLLDVLRAAVSEIEQYERVELGTLPSGTQVGGAAADDLSHLVAELLDNAAAFSPRGSEVRLTGRTLKNGEVAVSVQDDGAGLHRKRLGEVNARLEAAGTQGPPGDGDPLGGGLYVAARLAARHGMRVRLRARRLGGTEAVVHV
ncbi:nitrate- and nitrite sensing domain-containing protein, partial [Streptomyces boncukensis]|uniref:sensor histidine kinase n=1 Tax=Streptomyces boncukensis TaxID=2711219 RepID=UPI0030BA290E